MCNVPEFLGDAMNLALVKAVFQQDRVGLVDELLVADNVRDRMTGLVLGQGDEADVGDVECAVSRPLSGLPRGAGNDFVERLHDAVDAGHIIGARRNGGHINWVRLLCSRQSGSKNDDQGGQVQSNELVHEASSAPIKSNPKAPPGRWEGQQSSSGSLFRKCLPFAQAKGKSR